MMQAIPTRVKPPAITSLSVDSYATYTASHFQCDTVNMKWKCMFHMHSGTVNMKWKRFTILVKIR